MLNLALQLIENNKITQDPVLDLGNCGIDRIPEQLFECVWLERLILGNKYWSSKRQEWVISKNAGGPNGISFIPEDIGRLKNLRILKIGGPDRTRYLNEIKFLTHLPNLLSLDLSYNPIEDDALEPLTRLKDLLVFNFSRTPYHYQYYFLEEFENLRCLTLRGNSIEYVDFLESLRNLRVLDLADNRIANISFLRGLRYLKYLNLSSNNVTRIHYLEKLRRLKSLNLAFNQVEKADVLEDMAELTYLNLRSNYLRDTPHYFSKLRHLTHLDLEENTIRNISFLKPMASLEKLNLAGNYLQDASVIDQLTNLTSLSINDTDISNINFIEKLPHLKMLDISGTNINNITPLKSVPALRALYFSRSNLRSIRFLQYLPALEVLCVDGNQISDINFLSKCPQLSVLRIEDNKIKNISALAELPQLTYLDIRHNKITEIADLFSLTHLGATADVNLSGNPVMQQIPAEVIEAGWPVIKDRLLAIQHEQEFKVVKEVKLLLLGNTNVGKSNLLEYFETGNEPQLFRSTHGIQYRPVTTLINDVVINCWDFGGQEYFHATHQLFFSPGALNIILWSTQNITREEGEECFDIAYWLRCIEQLINNFYGREVSGQSEVIVCENKTDLKPAPDKFKAEAINAVPYIKKFPDLSLLFTDINLKPLKRMAGFRELLADKIESLFINLQQSYHKYLDVIRQHSAPFMLIKDISPHNPATVQNAMKVFHNMGIILYFPQISPEKIFNKPQSLLDLLYEKILSRGRSHKITVAEIKAAVYKNPLRLKFAEVIALLKHFDLVFQIPRQPEVFFIPQYLPEPSVTTQVLLDQLFVQKATVRVKSDHYLMNLAMLKIYTAYGRYVKDENPNEYLFWKDGIVIMKHQSILMIRFDRKGQAICLYSSRTGDNFHLQNEIVNFILTIQFAADKDKKPSLRQSRATGKEINWNSELFDVFVSNDGDYFVNWAQLFAQAKKGINKIDAFTIDASQSNVVPIIEFNQFLPGAGMFRPRNLFVSYAHEDLKPIGELEKFVATLKNEELINVWHDGMIAASDEFETQINENINKSDVFVLLVTQDFINSDFINRKELKWIFERLDESDARLIVVLLKTCDWKHWKAPLHSGKAGNERFLMSKFQMLPLYKKQPKAINEWSNKDEAWLQVTDAIRKAIHDHAGKQTTLP